MADEARRRLHWLPNALTVFRIATSPVIAGLLAARDPASQSAAMLSGLALLIFVAASLTDALDGWAARQLGAESALGAQLDLWADKALVAGCLAGFLLAGAFPLFSLAALGALTGRDLAIMALRNARPAASLGATGLAKSKSAIVMAGLAIVLLGLWLGDVGAWGAMTALGWVVVGIGGLLSIYTGLKYAHAAFAKPTA